MRIQSNTDLSSLNTLGLRSVAEHFIEIHSLQDIYDLQNDPLLSEKPWFILGGGSNLVLPAKIPGVVLKIANRGRELIQEDANYWFVKAQAGENWHDFVQYTLQEGYWGLENLSLIPGTVGAAPIQNIGAYGVEIKDLLWQVSALELSSGTIKTFSNSECGFSYRESFFKQEGAGRYLVWDVTFRLPKKNVLHLDYGDIRQEVERDGGEIHPRTIAAAVIKIRRTKLPDPQIIGNAGSFFKNPIVSETKRNELLKSHPDLVNFPYQTGAYKLAAGWLIDRAGWKGKNLGPVGMYEKQALVLVNRGGADANDVEALAREVAKDVAEKFGVTIEPEPIRW